LETSGSHLAGPLAEHIRERFGMSPKGAEANQ
jgi:hypothetical protein